MSAAVTIQQIAGPTVTIQQEVGPAVLVSTTPGATVTIAAQGTQGIQGPDTGVEYVDSIPDLTLIFNNGII